MAMVSSHLAYLKVLDFLSEHFNEMVGSDMVRDLAGWLCDLGKWAHIVDNKGFVSQNKLRFLPSTTDTRYRPFWEAPCPHYLIRDYNVQWDDCRWF